MLVDYFTRDGSTLTMRLLSTAPQIAVGGGYPYEHKYFAYLYRWARILDRADWPAEIWNGARLATLTQEEQTPLLGAPPWKPRDLFEAGRGGEDMSDYAFRMIWEEFSRRATAQTRKRLKRRDAEVRYYAEKHLSTWRVDLDRYPPMRVLAVLRDPRDTYVSITSFTRKRERAGMQRSMGRQPGESAEAWLERHLDRQKERLGWIRKAMKKGTMPIVRYEDLVLNLEDQAHRLEEMLEIQLDPAAVRADKEMRKAHVSAATPEASVGRWRREMSPDLVSKFNDELGDELEALGFDTTVPEPTEREATTVSEAPAE